MDDTFTFTLDDETEKRLFELLTDVDVSKMPSFNIKDKHGNEAEYVKTVRCKDCMWSEAKKSTSATMHCSWWYRAVRPDGFCNMAKREEE